MKSNQSFVNRSFVNRSFIWKLSVCAMMVAVSAVLRALAVQFYIGGALAMKVTFDGAFLAFGAMVGGPLLGAAAYGAADVVGYLVNPAGGAFMPLFTLVALVKGLLIGALWKVALNGTFKRAAGARPRRLTRAAEGYLRALFAIILPGLLATAANTVILKAYFITTDKGLWALMAPRVGKELLLTLFNAYLLTIIIAAYNKAFTREAA